MKGTIVQLPDREFIARLSRPQQLRDGGKRHLKMLFTAVCLIHRHIQVTSITGRIEVINSECPGTDGGFVNQAVVLPDSHPGAGPGNTADFRSVTTTGEGLHALIAFDFQP